MEFDGWVGPSFIAYTTSECQAVWSLRGFLRPLLYRSASRGDFLIFIQRLGGRSVPLEVLHGGSSPG
jgi:hypothetical protein